MTIQAAARGFPPRQNYNPFAPPCLTCPDQHMVNVITHQCLQNDPLGCVIKAVPNTVPLDLQDYVRIGDIIKLLEEAHDPLVSPDAPPSTLTSTSLSSSSLRPFTTAAPIRDPHYIVVTLTNISTSRTVINSSSPFRNSSIIKGSSVPTATISSAVVFTTGSVARVPGYDRQIKRAAIPTEHESNEPQPKNADMKENVEGSAEKSDKVESRSTITIADLIAHESLRKVLKIKQEHTSHEIHKRDLDHEARSLMEKFDSEELLVGDAGSESNEESDSNEKSNVLADSPTFSTFSTAMPAVAVAVDVDDVEYSSSPTPVPSISSTISTGSPVSTATHSDTDSRHLAPRIEPPYHPFPPPEDSEDPIIRGRELLDMLFLAGAASMFLIVFVMYVLQRRLRGYRRASFGGAKHADC